MKGRRQWVCSAARIVNSTSPQTFGARKSNTAAQKLCDMELAATEYIDKIAVALQLSLNIKSLYFL